jgi:hypothetical protein
MRYRFLKADEVKDDAIRGACSWLCEIRSGTFLYGNSNIWTSWELYRNMKYYLNECYGSGMCTGFNEGRPCGFM